MASLRKPYHMILHAHTSTHQEPDVHKRASALGARPSPSIMVGIQKALNKCSWINEWMSALTRQEKFSPDRIITPAY